MLKVGVFGVGHLGKFHLNNWKEIDDIELVGFYDPDDTNANEVAEKYGLKNTEGWWNKLVADDIDSDGDLDIIAGNLGENYKFKDSLEKTFEV